MRLSHAGLVAQLILVQGCSGTVSGGAEPLSSSSVPSASVGTTQAFPPGDTSGIVPPSASNPQQNPAGSASATAAPVDTSGAPLPPNTTPEGSATAPPPVVDVCATGVALTNPRIWRLTNTQLSNTLQDQFGYVPPAIASLPGEARLEGFANRAQGLKVSPLLAEGYYRVAEELAGDVIADGARYGLDCDIGEVTDACLDGFIASFGEKMWRRPLLTAEQDRLNTLYGSVMETGEGPTGGVMAVVQAVFLSPNFLHRSELGTTLEPGAVTPLTDYELASALSYTLWDSAPDQTLLDLARDGQLRDQAVLTAQAERMYASEKTSRAMHHFLSQWLFIENLSRSEKDLSLYAMGTPEVAADTLEETRLLMNSVLFDAAGDRSFKTLFTANYGFVNERTAPLYGINDVSGEDFVRRDLNPAERRGLFTLAAFMWAHAGPTATHLVTRGAYFRGEVLCSPVPPPPAAVIMDVDFAAEDATGREKLETHATPACATCHALFDGLGFAMESYDAVGRFRLLDNGKPIDPSGTIPLPSQPEGPGAEFANFVELIDQLAETPDVYNCFAKQYTAYTAGLAPAELDACQQKTIRDQFEGAEYKLDDLMLSVISSPSFMDRQNSSQ